MASGGLLQLEDVVGGLARDDDLDEMGGVAAEAFGAERGLFPAAGPRRGQAMRMDMVGRRVAVAARCDNDNFRPLLAPRQ